MLFFFLMFISFICFRPAIVTWDPASGKHLILVMLLSADFLMLTRGSSKFVSFESTIWFIALNITDDICLLNVFERHTPSK